MTDTVQMQIFPNSNILGTLNLISSSKYCQGLSLKQQSLFICKNPGFFFSKYPNLDSYNLSVSHSFKQNDILGKKWLIQLATQIITHTLILKINIIFHINLFLNISHFITQILNRHVLKDQDFMQLMFFY